MKIDILIGVILQLSLIFMNLSFLTMGVNFNKKSILELIILLIVGIFIFNIFGKISVLLCMLVLVMNTFYYSKNLSKSIAYVSISIIAMVLSDYFSNYIFIFMNNKKFSFSFYVILLCVINYIIIFLFRKILIQKITTWKHIISVPILIVIIMYYYIIIYMESLKIQQVIPMLLFLLLICFVVIVVAINIIKKKNRVEWEKTEREYLQEYYKDLENHYKEIQSFRHDFKNLLYGIEIYMQTKDINGLRNYCEDLKNYSDIFEEITLKELNNIKVKSLKGFMYKKIKDAEKLNINIRVECTERLEVIDIEIIDLIRSLGIVIDNSIEAVKNLKDNNSIDIGFIKFESSILIVVENYCIENNIDINEIFKYGFTTKKNGQGIGLNSLEKILIKYKNVNHEIKVLDNKLIHKFMIFERTS